MFDNVIASADPAEEAEDSSTTSMFDLRNGSEYADVIEPDDVERLVNAGQLERIYLVSPIFGGAEDIRNIVTAGQGAARAKQEIDTAVVTALEQCEDLAYDVVPDYGDSHSLVPQRITFTAGSQSYIIITWDQPTID
ncbi:hypothetical protein [Demetria terragena]|uniref:hypothetical protein n=1 Tax=Demetria terragena TaxID=63959 RepID=UPI000380ECE5|nr:hypothetical protein [Demetria terragena]